MRRALATDGDIFVGGAKQQEMLTFLNVFRKAGRMVRRPARTASGSAAAATLKPVVVETDVHPGFMTDWQQPLIVALTQARGLSIVHETVYENRLGFTEALNADGRRHRQVLPRRPRRRPACRVRAGAARARPP